MKKALHKETDMNGLDGARARLAASLTSIFSKAQYGFEMSAAILVTALAGFLFVPKLAGLCGVLFDPVTTVQPIQVSEALREQGYTEATLQQLLIDALGDLRADASGVTPKADAEKVLSEFKIPDVELPGTGISIRPLIEFARSLLKRDSTVYGSVVGSPSGFAVMLTLREPDGHTVPLRGDSETALAALKEMDRDASPHLQTGMEAATLKQALRAAAEKILEHQSPLLYASYLTQVEQRRCLEGEKKCDFAKVRKLFAQIAAGAHSDNSRENAAWAKLALSKLDTYAGDYEGTIKLSSEIVELSDKYSPWEKVRPWAYYNWGVALNDLGCYQQAAQVLSRSVNERTDSEPAAHNALARAFLALASTGAPALASDASDSGDSGDSGNYGMDLVIVPPGPPPRNNRDAAIAELDAALKANPGYQEAYVNLGDALQLQSPQDGLSKTSAQSTLVGDSREAYWRAVDLDVEQADRAYERLIAMKDPDSMKVAQRRDAPRRTQCEQRMARSLLEAWGCSDRQIEAVSGRAPAAASEPAGQGLLHTAAGAAAEPAVCRQYDLRSQRSLRAPTRPAAGVSVKWTALRSQTVSPSKPDSEAEPANHGA
jgi:tetratricopeptide (TPR) repeat protein